MSTLENTISMMEVLPEKDLLEIQSLVQKIFQRHEGRTADEEGGKFLKPMSEEDFLKDVEHAEYEIENGKCRRANEVWSEI